MQRDSLLAHLWKVPVSGLVFFVGLMLGSMAASAVGLAAPAMPAGADASTLFLYQIIVGLLLALTLAWLARGLTGGFVWRWLSLSMLTWIVYALNTYLEASIFTTYSGASPYVLVMDLSASLLCGATVALLFPPKPAGMAMLERIRAYVHQHPPAQWAGRLLAAWVAFPVIYILFGLLVQPVTGDYYRQQVAGLTAPGWGQIIPIVLLRSLFFLAACLPVLIAWQKSARDLFITLSITLFMFVGGLYMLQAYWFPPIIRIAHSLEILADSIMYSGALVYLLVWPPTMTAQRKMVGVGHHPRPAG